MKRSHQKAISQGQKKSWAPGGAMRLACEKRRRAARKALKKRR